MQKMPAPAATPAAAAAPAAAPAPVPASIPIPFRQTLFPGYSPGSFLSAAGFPVSVAGPDCFTADKSCASFYGTDCLH